MWWSCTVLAALCCILWLCWEWRLRTGAWLEAQISVAPSKRRYLCGLRWLAIPLVLECVWRSVLPCLYLSRQTFFDTPLNSIMLALTLEIIGEVAWISQVAWAIVFVGRQLQQCPGAISSRSRRALLNDPRSAFRSEPHSQATGSQGLCACASYIAASLLLFACLLGEVTTFLGAVTTRSCYLFFEECCWLAISIDAMASGFFLFCRCRRLTGADRLRSRSANVFCLFLVMQGFVNVPHMALCMIPCSYSRWQQDERSGKPYLSFSDGLSAATTTRNPTRVWSGWSGEWFWMNAFFLFASWSSIWMLRGPCIDSPLASAAAAREFLEAPMKDPRTDIARLRTSSDQEAQIPVL